MKKKIAQGLLASALLTMLFTAPANAEESLFSYVYTTDLLPQGQKEVEQWLTQRHAKSRGSYDVWEGRTAIEYGVTDKFQVALYANYEKATANRNNVDGTTLVPETFADYSYDAGSRFDESRFQGFSFEGIYRILSPYTDPIGLALYVEPTVGPNLRELESKAIVQKNFLDDRLVFAANLTLAQEMRWMKTDLNGSGEPASWDRETDLNLGIGASYRFAPNWSAGIELEHEREYSSFHLSKKYRTNVATYLGPNIHYGGKDFFVTATFLTQVGGGKDYASDAGSSFVVGGRNYADDFEKDRLRIKAGYYF
jgi:hypothetical protein